MALEKTIRATEPESELLYFIRGCKMDPTAVRNILIQSMAAGLTQPQAQPDPDQQPQEPAPEPPKKKPARKKV